MKGVKSEWTVYAHHVQVGDWLLVKGTTANNLVKITTVAELAGGMFHFGGAYYDGYFPPAQRVVVWR